MTDASFNPNQFVGKVLLDKFVLKRCIGEGASGMVFAAEQRPLGRTVAVKLLHPAHSQDERLSARFHAEALAASRLNHPNTVSIIDYGETRDGLLFIVMEFLQGKTLTQILLQDFPLPPATIVDIALQILAGMEEAHGEGIVHADLKCDNIVVERRRGNWNLVKVVDFGIARMVGEQADASNTICGTPEYMAPELVTGQPPTIQSDLYSLGIILYELFARQTPFVGGDIVDVLKRQMTEAPPAFPSSVQVPKEMQTIIRHALAKKAGERFQTCAEFRAALEELRVTAPSESAETFLCTGCGIYSATRFKFCPECGLPRELPAAPTPTPSAQPDLHVITPGKGTETIPPLESLGTWPMPFVGRTDEQETLLHFFHSQYPGSIKLAGNRRTGVSRLLSSTYAMLPAGAMVYHTNPDPSGIALPFHPIRALVEAILGVDWQTNDDEIALALKQKGLDESDLPGVLEVFSRPSLPWLNRSTKKRELFAAARRILCAAAAAQGAVITFADVHLYDSISQEFVARMVGGTNEFGLRILLTLPPDELEQWPTDQTILIENLSKEATAELSAHLRKNATTHMPDADTLFAMTGGLPGHIHHLARFVGEGGELEDAPPTLPDLITNRLNLLSREQLIVLQCAAVLGAETSKSVLKKLVLRSGELHFDNEFSVLVARGFLWSNEDMTGFSDTLVMEITIDAMPADVRRTFFREAAGIIRAYSPPPGLLGHMLQSGGEHAEAAIQLMTGGDDYARQLDDIGACTMYQRAHSSARRALLIDDDTVDTQSLFVALSIKLADSLRLQGQTGLAKGILEEAKSMCEETSLLQVHLVRASAYLQVTQGEITDSARTIRRAIGSALPTGNFDLLSSLYLDFSTLLIQKGSVAEALSELSEFLNLASFSDNQAKACWQVALRIAQIRYSTGDVEDAVRSAERALSFATVAKTGEGIARCHSFLASAYDKLKNQAAATQHRNKATHELRSLGDRRDTEEIVLLSLSTSRTLRIQPESLGFAFRREAK